MVITVRAVFIRLLEFFGVLSKTLLAFLAGEDHLILLEQRVVLGLLMAFRAVEPFSACSFIALDTYVM